MGPIEHIRKNVLGLSQAKLAAVAHVTQATVSRWEAGEFEPSREEMRLIRDEAISRGIGWNDAWFFVVPIATDHSQAAE